VRLDLSKLIIQDQDLADSSRLDVTFFKNSGITRFWTWTKKETLSAFFSIPNISIPKPWEKIFLIVSIIGCVSYFIFLLLLFCVFLFKIKQFNQLGEIIGWTSLIGSTGLLPGMIYATLQTTPIFGMFLFFTIPYFFITLIKCIIEAIWFKLIRCKSLKGILKEIKKYNQLIKAIDINDQLESVNQIKTTISDREKVIEALQLTRLDLIRALKTEKILWDNKGFMKQNPTIFVNSLDILEGSNA
jgi:hypothetical protein